MTTYNDNDKWQKSDQSDITRSVLQMAGRRVAGGDLIYVQAT